MSCEEHFCSVSGASESSPDLTFIQQESILQSMVNDVGDAFPDLILQWQLEVSNHSYK